MIDRLAEWVATWPEQDIAPLLLQDMALCRAWCKACRHDPDMREDRARIHERIAFWRHNHTPFEENTEGRRHQILLRQALDIVQADRAYDLDGDQVEFLLAVLELLAETPGELHARVAGILTPYADVLHKRSAGTRASTGLALLSKRILYVTEKDILAAPQRETRLLAGIELPCRGPVLTAHCHIRVLGDVPDDATVVVEGNGHCCVDGYLMGRVLSKTQCEVRGNISGVAVVLREDIRARSIINNALVVAKMGSVHARSAQGPKLIFAGKMLRIRGGTMMGHYIARQMEVDEDVRGGKIQVTGGVKARCFGHLGTNNLAVVLRNELSCEDFGEVTGTELNHLLSDAYRLRRRIRNFEAIADISLHEAEHTAQSVLMYLFGGSETQKKLEELVALQNRLNLLNRMIANLEDSLEDAEQGIERPSAKFDEPASDMLTFDNEGAVDADLMQENEDILRLQRSLTARLRDRRETSRLVKRADEKLDTLREERDLLAATLTGKEREFHSQGKYEKLLAGTSKGETKLQVLQKILPMLRKQPGDGTIATRMKTGFVTMALRNIDRRLGYICDYRKRAAESRQHFQAVSDQLGKDFQVRIREDSDKEKEPAQVEGRFEEDVRIYIGCYVDDASELPEGRIISTCHEDEPRIFARVTKSRIRGKT